MGTTQEGQRVSQKDTREHPCFRRASASREKPRPSPGAVQLLCSAALGLATGRKIELTARQKILIAHKCFFSVITGYSPVVIILRRPTGACEGLGFIPAPGRPCGE